MKASEVEFGQRLKCRITGFTGIVVNISSWSNGCVNIGLRPEELKEGAMQDIAHIDIQDLELIEDEVHAPPKRLAGGPKLNQKSPTG